MGDVPIKPLQAGAVSLEGFSEHYYALSTDPEAQQALLDDVLNSQNIKEIEVRFENDPAFRKTLKEGCAKDKADCSELRDTNKKKPQ